MVGGELVVGRLDRPDLLLERLRNLLDLIMHGLEPVSHPGIVTEPGRPGVIGEQGTYLRTDPPGRDLLHGREVVIVEAFPEGLPEVAGLVEATPVMERAELVFDERGAAGAAVGLHRQQGLVPEDRLDYVFDRHVGAGVGEAFKERCFHQRIEHGDAIPPLARDGDPVLVEQVHAGIGKGGRCRRPAPLRPG